MNDILSIIDELQEEFAQGKNVFWSKKSLVNLERCEELILQLKHNLPASIQEAYHIVSQKDKIIERAQITAQNTIKEAEARAENLVCESAVVKKEDEESARVLADAEKKCSLMYQTTKNNIDKLLKAIEDYFVDNLHVVRCNREELAGKLLTKKGDTNN